MIQTVASMDEVHLPSIGNLMEVLDLDVEARAELMLSPREYLETQTLVSDPIILECDAFQVTVLDLGKEFDIVEGEEEVDVQWYTVAEQLEDLEYQVGCVGLFYEHIGIVIQETKEPSIDEVAVERTVGGEIKIYLETVIGLTDDALEEIKASIKELNGLDVESDERAKFLDNPRQYIYDKAGITLPAIRYRVIAIDFDKAAELGVVARGEIRPGLVVVPEGIGKFFDNVGIFIQQAK
jgi:hypothetical protein